MTNHVCLKDAIEAMIHNEKALVDFSRRYADLYKTDEKASRIFMETADKEKTHAQYLEQLLGGLTKDQCTFVIDNQGKNLVAFDPEKVGGYTDHSPLTLEEAVRTLEICEEKNVDALKNMREIFSGKLNVSNVIHDDKEILDKIFSYKQVGEAFSGQYVAGGYDT